MPYLWGSNDELKFRNLGPGTCFSFFSQPTTPGHTASKSTLFTIKTQRAITFSQTWTGTTTYFSNQKPNMDYFLLTATKYWNKAWVCFSKKVEIVFVKYMLIKNINTISTKTIKCLVWITLYLKCLVKLEHVMLTQHCVIRFVVHLGIDLVNTKLSRLFSSRCSCVLKDKNTKKLKPAFGVSLKN